MIKRDMVETILAYIVAISITCSMIYFLPLLFIGIVLGFALGKYYDKISEKIFDNN